MRIISYDEYILNIKSDFYYVNLAYNIKHNKNYFTDILFKEEEHFEKFHNQHPLNTFIEYIEVLVNDNILSTSEVIALFKEKEITDNNCFNRLQEYITIYENRQNKNDFPFKFKIDIEILKEKYNSIKDNFSICNSQYEYTPYQLTAPTYEELMEYYKNSELYEEIKKSLNTTQSITDLGYTQPYIEYPYISARLILNYLQIFIDENIISNKFINKIISELTNYDFTKYLVLILDYTNEYLYIKNTNWHKYTIEIDVDMLINKVLCYYNEYEQLINKERFLAIFEKYNIKIDTSIDIAIRKELDNYYKEKYKNF